MFSKSLIQVIHASSSSSMLPFLSMLLFLSYRNSHSPKSEIPTFSLPSWWSISYSNSIFTHLPYYLNSPFSTAFLIRRPTLSGVRKVQTLIRRLTQLRVGKVEGTPERPRLCVFRSNKHLYVQVTDDSKIHTLASASTMQKPVSEELDITSGPTVEVAKKVGEIIAKSCLEKGIMKVAIDRGGYPYHRCIEALAEAAREHCLQF